MDSILLNKLYTGEYSKRKIGHEVINFFKADNDNVYAYIAPLGAIAKERYYNIKMVVFLSEYKDQKCELLGVAEVKPIIEKRDYNKLKFKNDEEYEDYIEKYIRNKISYNKIDLDKIFDKDEKDKYNPLVNFLVDKMWVPKNEKSIYFTHYSASKSIKNPEKEIKYESHENVIYRKLYHSLQRQMCYVEKGEKTIIDGIEKNEYDQLIKWIGEWIDEGTLVEEDLPKVEGEISNNYNILSLMDKENEEQIYTNLLTSFFNEYIDEKEKVFDRILGENGHFDVVKEKVVSVDINGKEKKGRIDIFAIDKHEDNKQIILIENKIDSGLNGIIASKNINSNPLSQLNIYEMFLKQYYKGYNSKIIVLCPKENVMRLNSEIEACAKLNVECTIVTYDDLINLIRTNEKYYDDNILKGYYHEFMKILKLLTLNNKQITLNKFYNKIQEKKRKVVITNV